MYSRFENVLLFLQLPTDQHVSSGLKKNSEVYSVQWRDNI